MNDFKYALLIISFFLLVGVGSGALTILAGIAVATITIVPLTVSCFDMLSNK